jgi:adenylate cyclase
MSSNDKQRALDKVKFSIAAKLIIIISFIVVISLGLLTALVLWLIQTDLRITAEENIFETNRRSAIEAETLLTNTRSNTRVLIQTVSALGTQTSAARELINSFWTENPQIAAVFFVIPGRREQLLINRRFFTSRQINDNIVSPYFDSQKAALGRAVLGESVLQNATPHFLRAVSGLFFPWQGEGVGAVLFSCENLNINYGYGINKSYMLNTDGDILSHVDFDIIKEKTNIKDMDFIRVIFNSPEHNGQHLMETDFGVTRSPSNNVNLGVLTPAWEKASSTVKFAVNKSVEMLKKYDILNIEIKEKKPRQYVAYTKLNTANAVVITSIEYDKMFEGITAAVRLNICLAAAVLLISIIFIWLFSRTISIPLAALAAAARKIEGGKFDLRLRSQSGDEIGVLTNNFGRMCSALNIFGRFTNKDIAVRAINGEIKPGGLSKHGTVFFSDIRDFTVKLDSFIRFFGAEASDKIILWLNQYFTEMVNCVEKSNGIVDKFIGSAVMAHWGTAYSAGSPRKDAFNCVKAALMMRKVLFFMNRERRAEDHVNPSIRIGCGINSGVLTAGQIGADTRMEYTVLGDPVDMARRIEALTKPLGADILISEDTWKLVGDKFIAEEMPSVPVKGKGKPLRLFAVVNFSGEVKGPQSMDEVRSLLGIETPNLDETMYA